MLDNAPSLTNLYRAFLFSPYITLPKSMIGSNYLTIDFLQKHYNGINISPVSAFIGKKSSIFKFYYTDILINLRSKYNFNWHLHTS